MFFTLNSFLSLITHSSKQQGREKFKSRGGGIEKILWVEYTGLTESETDRGPRLTLEVTPGDAIFTPDKNHMIEDFPD